VRGLLYLPGDDHLRRLRFVRNRPDLRQQPNLPGYADVRKHHDVRAGGRHLLFSADMHSDADHM
jgi:hypothetical protein